MANVKGSALQSRLRWIQLKHGESGINRLAASLATKALADVATQGAKVAEWYPFEWFVELNTTVDQTFGAGDLALVRELGRHSADASLTTIYRLFFKVGRVKWILARASRLWGMHYDSGAMQVTVRPGNLAKLSIENFDTPHRIHCLSVAGWCERATELSGGTDVRVDEVACRARGDEACTLDVRWS